VTVRVLVTGSEGQVGRCVTSALEGAGHHVVRFDLAGGDDILDEAALRSATAGCVAVVHLAALAHDSAGTPSEIMSTNVIGTWHVLLSAAAAAVERVVHFSSVQVFGLAGGEREPDYLPIDDDHPLYAVRPYGLSKRLSEDLCEAFSRRNGIPTICLRPVGVWDSSRCRRVELERNLQPSREWEPFWEFGAFVDVRDVASATLAALSCPDPGHARVTLCAPDISASAPARSMASRLLPLVPWRGGHAFEADPWRALFDCRRAHDLLGWQPAYRWSDRPRLSARGGREED
jgi:nucleoside-diphosphate-sugar epimerase